MNERWPADQVERRNVADLVPYARNSRTHNAAQVNQIAASIKEWGWTTPVLIDESGMIIAGHGRVLAAQKLGVVTIPVMVATGWSDAKKRAYVIADNQLALTAGWDEELLKIEMSELSHEGFDLTLTGFDIADIDKMLGKLAETEAEEACAQLTDMKYQIVVDCGSEMRQIELLDEFEKAGISCRALIS
jgi:ParB-like chromosome segregation protein Spo0J